MPTNGKQKLSPLALVLILSSSFFAVFLAISGALFLYRGTATGSHSLHKNSFFNKGTVGIVELNGVILDSKKTLSRLDQFEEDSEVKAVILRMNSPGGAVAPSQEIYEAVRAYKKPLVVSMGSVAASGAFYIACGAKKVFANPGTLTGSIGVIMEFANLEKLYEWAKIKRYVIKTGKFKDAGSEFREMTAEEQGLLQTMIDTVLKQFKTAVSVGRKLPFDEVTKIADGRIMSGSQAKEAKLVDVLGTLNDAVMEAARMANIKGKPNVVYPEHDGHKWLELLLDDNAKDESRSEFPPLGTALRKFLGDSSAGLSTGIYWLWTGGR